MLRGDDLGKGTDDVLLLKSGHDVALEILRHEVAAVSVRTLGQHVVNENLAAKVAVEVLLVGIGRMSGLVGLDGRSPFGSLGDRLVHGLVQFRFDGVPALHALDLVGEAVQVMLHLGVGGVILRGKDAHVVPVGIEESLHRVPQLGSLVSHLCNSHDKNPPCLKQFFVKRRPQFIDRASFGFLLRLAGCFAGNLAYEGAFHR